MPIFTIADDNVISNYLDILIPKAVKYSAGLLDYYFRGNLGVGVSNVSSRTFTLQITNLSGQAFNGGAFHLFYDDAESNRMEIVDGPDYHNTYTYTGTLASNGVVTATFVAPDNITTNYLLVFRGTIGVSNGTALDPVDAGLAIAAQKFTAIEADWSVGGVIDRWQNVTQTRPPSNDPDETATAAPYPRIDPSNTEDCPGIPGACGFWLVDGDLNGVVAQEIKDSANDILPGAAGDSTHATIDHNSYAKATVTAGAFVTGDFYKIVTVGTTDFTAIGATNNNVGTAFTATGPGSGTGTAALAVDMRSTRFGGQWVLAQKQWHGCFGWTSADAGCDTPDPTIAPDQTKYLTCDTSATLSGTSYVNFGRERSTSYTTGSVSGGVSVGRLTGIKSSNLSTYELEQGETPSSPLVDISLTQDGAQTIYNGDGSVYSYVPSGAGSIMDRVANADVHCGGHVIPPIPADNSRNIADMVSDWNSTHDSDHQLPAPDNPDSYDASMMDYEEGIGTYTVNFSWSRSATVYSAAYSIAFADDRSPHTKTSDDQFSVTITLSNPYTGDDLLADFKSALNAWDMSDFDLAKLRTDETLALAPLVVYDERSAVSPVGFVPALMDDYSKPQNGDGTWPARAWIDPSNYVWKDPGGGFLDVADPAGGSILVTPLQSGHIVAHSQAGSDRHFWFGYRKMKRVLSDDETYYEWEFYKNGAFSDTTLPAVTMRWLDNQAAQYDGVANINGGTPPPGNFPQAFINQYGGKMLGGKYVQAVQDWPAVNFGRPCGPDKFAIDQPTVCCVNASASPVFTIKKTGNAIAPLATGGLMVNDYIGIAGDGIYKISTLAAADPDDDGNPQWTLTVGTKLDDLPTGFSLAEPYLGRLRWPSAPGICGRAAITTSHDAGTGLVTITCDSLPYLRLDPATGHITVDIYDDSMTNLATSVNLTRVSDTSFTFSHAAMPTAAYMTGHGVTWTNYDSTSQQTGVHLDWSFDQRSAALPTESQPAWFGGSGAGTGTGIAGCTGCTKTQFNYGAGGFKAVVGIVPGGNAGENFSNQALFDFPAEFFCDDVYGGHWQAAVMLTMPDPFWQAPFKPDGEIENPNVLKWVEDDGSGHEDTESISDGGATIYTKYCAHHPLVEVLATLPSGKTLPAGVTLPCAADIAPPYYPNGIPIGDVGGNYGDIETDWGFADRACANISGSGRFSDIYSTFISCP